MTTVAIRGEDWLVDGRPTHAGRDFRGHRIEGLLLNSRMANGVFDDANPLTRHLWAYPDTGEWDAQRNLAELIAMLPEYCSYGLDAVCVNLQGASPLGYYRSHDEGIAELLARIHDRHPDTTNEDIWAGLPGQHSQPWDSGAMTPEGTLKPDFLARTGRLIQAADRAGLVVVLGLFYFGQDERLIDEAAVVRAVENACTWVLEQNFANVVVEINNECNVPRYEHEILTPRRVHELIALAKSISGQGRRLLVGTSFAREDLPTKAVIAESDFILLHGNGIDDPAELADRVDETRAIATYAGQPIVFNEDDHFDFDRPENNFIAALSRRAGWGFFDPGPGAGGRAAYGQYVHGYQNPPINWGLNTPRKQAFFDLLAEVTGSPGPASV
ncbi:MAG: hypothetical protein ACR2RL_27105 [Gammaproteobacteria bacterium]